MTTDEQERIRNCAKCKNYGRDFCDHKQYPHLATMRWAIVCSRFRPLKTLIDQTSEQLEEDVVEIDTVKTLRQSGSSVTATISPSELKALNVGVGDTISLTIRRL